MKELTKWRERTEEAAFVQNSRGGVVGGSETKSKDGRTEGKAIKGHPAPRWPQSPLSEGRTYGRTDGMTVEWTMAAEYKIGHIFRRKGSRKGETNGCGEWPLWREGLPLPPLVSGRESGHKGHNGIAP